MQAYVRSHVNTAIYVCDFLKHAKAHEGEKRQVEELIAALTRLLKQVGFAARCNAVPCRAVEWSAVERSGVQQLKHGPEPLNPP